MKKELTDKLYKDFPNLFKQKDLPPSQSCMYWGVAVGNGWFGIIYELCEKLQKVVRDDFCFIQIKEKFGYFRCYTNYFDGKAESLIAEAALKSMKVCEVCGSKENVQIRRDGWISVICDECYKKGD